MNTVSWPLGNNQTLEFTSYDTKTTTWNAVAGLYIFAYFDGQYWRALYVGQTNDFSSRIPSHERVAEAFRLGATHIHATVVPQAAKRDTLEKSLISHLQPRLNEQHKDLNRRAA
jgi:excinuclease UvrABC nuclease subunit